MRILLADSNHDILHQTLQKAGFECDLYWDRSSDELQSILPSYDGLVIRSKFKIGKELLDMCPNLKCVGRVGAGMENIDVPYAESKGVICVCVPEGNCDAVGEHAIGMLLMLLNHLKKADLEVRQGIWLRAQNRGTEIKNKTIGIIGFGHMGFAFAEKLSGFGCKILAYDKYKTGFGNQFVQEASLLDIHRQTDVLSIHLPYSEETHYYINKRFLAEFTKPVYIINTARGKCLNTVDLIDALERGSVLGACLDVLEYESLSFENLAANQVPEAMKYLLRSDKVILSPHIAGWTHESNFKMSEMIAKKMIVALSANR